MGAQHGKIKLYNGSSRKGTICKYVTSHGCFTVKPTQIHCNGGHAVVEHESCHSNFHGAFNVSFGDRGEFRVEIYNEYHIVVRAVKKTTLERKAIKARSGCCVCICCNTHCTNIMFYNDCGHHHHHTPCPPPTPTPTPPPEKKEIQFVLANNTTLLGNVMVDGAVHSTVPGAGGVVEPKFDDPLFNEFDIVFPGEGTFHVVADYDAKTCTVTPAEDNAGEVVSKPEAEVDVVGAVMTPIVRFFVEEVGAYTIYLQLTNGTDLRGSIDNTDRSKNVWRNAKGMTPGVTGSGENTWIDAPIGLPSNGGVVMPLIIGSALPMTETFKVNFGDDDTNSITVTANYTESEGTIKLTPPSTAAVTSKTGSVEVNDMTMTGGIEFLPTK